MIYTIDFETEGIEARPKYPPTPVGVSIKEGSKEPRYFAWGHPTQNNCTRERAAAMLRDIWRNPDAIVLTHNGKFDYDVAQVHLGLPLLPWARTHDTLFDLFLYNPHAANLKLKPSAEAILGIPNTEQMEVRQWLIDQGICARNDKNWGRFISKAPGKLVGRYAKADVEMTYKLHRFIYPTFDEGMRGAYDRERKLMPLLLENERQGMRVDVRRLEVDLIEYEKALVKVDGWIRKQLRCPGLNLDADADVAAALRAAGEVTNFPKTDTGRDSVSKKNLLPEHFKTKDLWLALYYRNALVTVLSMSMRPWLAQAQENNGYVFTEWNQVRGEKNGARSGRITCSRFQNITKDFLDRGDSYGVTGDTRIRKKIGLPPLPLVRKYLLPDPGDLFCHRDYNQQEMRLVAHYEDGALSRAYNSDSAMDVHAFVQDLILRVTGKHYERRPVKIVDFRTVYGGGARGLAAGLRWPLEEAQELIQSWKRALPDVVRLDAKLKELFYRGLPLRTYGGRIYHCKPPAVAKKGDRKGQLISFEYTALNYLIQPSGADVTKEAIIRYHEHPKKESRMLVTVHDEINLSAPRKIAKQQNAVLRECMESIKLDVPWKTDGDERISWGEKLVAK